MWKVQLTDRIWGEIRLLLGLAPTDNIKARQDMTQLKKQSKVWHSNNKMKRFFIQSLDPNDSTNVEVGLFDGSLHLHWDWDCRLVSVWLGLNSILSPPKAAPSSYCPHISKVKTKVLWPWHHISPKSAAKCMQSIAIQYIINIKV